MATAINNCARITYGLFGPVDAVLLLDQPNAPIVVCLWDANGEVVAPVISIQSVGNPQTATGSNQVAIRAAYARHSGR